MTSPLNARLLARRARPDTIRNRAHKPHARFLNMRTALPIGLVLRSFAADGVAPYLHALSTNTLEAGDPSRGSTGRHSRFAIPPATRIPGQRSSRSLQD